MINNLDQLNKKILYELDQNSRITFKELAKKLGVAKETVNFRIKKLTKDRYIQSFLTTINISNINKFYYKLFYKFHKTTPEIEQEIIDFIKNYKATAYFASLEGRYNLTFLVLSKNVKELYEFLIPFKEKFGEYILEEEILTMTSVHRFNFRFFYKLGKLIHTKYSEELVDQKLDLIDNLVIKNLSKDSRISLVELAKITNTEINVIKYRIKKLKEKGIIGAHVLSLNFEKLGYQQFQINFKLKKNSTINKLINYSAHFPECTFATTTMGKYDLALEFVVENIIELRKILNNIKKEFSNEIIDHDIFIMEEHSINWLPL